MNEINKNNDLFEDGSGYTQETLVEAVFQVLREANKISVHARLIGPATFNLLEPGKIELNFNFEEITLSKSVAALVTNLGDHHLDVYATINSNIFPS